MFVRARAHVRALMTQKSCAVGMRNAKPGNHLNHRGIYSRILARVCVVAMATWLVKDKG